MPKMNAQFNIKSVAVLGAGVMGAQIAAHFNNAGFEATLFDLPKEGADKNAIVNQSIKKLEKVRPPALAYPKMKGISAANYAEHIEKIRDCDLIIEAISEKIEHKQNLFEQVADYISPRAIVASNTSGISINKLAEILPAQLKTRFCGIHFFNPPRAMKLVELIPSHDTSPDVVDHLETLLTTQLGKNIIRAKDTPNFVANRIGVFSLLNAIQLAEKYDIAWDTLDALTGLGIGRAKSATCRTLDIVGLDTFSLVVSNMAAQLADDPWSETFRLPDSIKRLVAEGAIGSKAGKGFFSKGKNTLVYSRKTNGYVDADSSLPIAIQEILSVKDPAKKLNLLRESLHPMGQFLWQHLTDVFLYCAYHLPQIANSTKDVDMAMRWGFGWHVAPFEWWQSAGWSRTTNHLKAALENGICSASIEFPAWVETTDSVYKPGLAFSPQQNSFQNASDLPVYQRQINMDVPIGAEEKTETLTIAESNFSRLWCKKGEDVAVLSVLTKGGVVTSGVLDDIHSAVDYVEKNRMPLVIWQEGRPFSFGADLHEFQDVLASATEFDLSAYVEKFQQTSLRIKYSAAPVVAAIELQVLGGGCEIAMHADLRVAAFETYMGLVEAKVGLLPAGGGCKTMMMRAEENAAHGMLMPWLEDAFDTIASAKISTSALHAKELGLLLPHDVVVMHERELLHVAIHQAMALQESAYIPPKRNPVVSVAGRKGLGILNARLANLKEGGYISDHDYQVAKNIALVLCGGDINENTEVDEEWLLSLERQYFVDLFNQEKTTDRVRHMLENGRPLRN